MIRTVLALSLLAASGTYTHAQNVEPPVDVNIAGATATIIDLAGANQGRAVIRPTPNGRIFITISATGLARGWHAVHVHERGECDPATGFQSAGEHLGGGAHGYLAEGGPHAGDLPNQMVQEDGTLVAEIITDRMGWSRDGDAALFDADGSAIIIHAQRDDYQTQPGGSAGDRLMCGVFEIPPQ